MKKIPEHNVLKRFWRKLGHGWGRGVLLLALCVPSCAVAAAPADDMAEKSLTAEAAAICAGTYHTEDGQESAYLKDGGWDVKPLTLNNGQAVAHVILARHKEPLHGQHWTVLAFRGSASKADWKLNLKTDRVPFAEKEDDKKEKAADSVPQVHKGFWQYTKAALDSSFDVDGDGRPDKMADWLKKHPEEKLLITGHSLGGAGATLYGEALAEQGVPKTQIPVITFGAPAVGNKAFADTYGDKIDLLRVYTTLDPIPGVLQTFYSGYQQFGRKEEFPLSGKKADYQHPVSYYLDLAVKNYYDTRDALEKENMVQPQPAQQKKGGGPLTALVVYTQNNGADPQLSPDVGRFILDEYRSLLPNYIVLEQKELPKEQNEITLSSGLREKARQAGADALVAVVVEKKRIGKTDAWSLQVAQEITGLKTGSFQSVAAGSTRVRWEQGFLQSALNLWQSQKNMLGQLIPLQTGTDPLWNWQLAKGADADGNH